MRPSALLLKIVAGLALLSLLLGIGRLLFADLLAVASWQTLIAPVWLIILLGLVGVATLDVFFSRSRSIVSCVRNHPGSLALGAKSAFSLSIKNETQRRLTVVVSELAPQELNITAFPLQVNLPAARTHTIQYYVTPEQRGDIVIDGVQMFVGSVLGLWQLNYTLPITSRLKVFPNFMAISHMALLLQGGNSRKLGIHLLQRRGQGTDFHQLRDYRESDSQRQVDWNATAKMGKLIAREFQDEKDQQVLFLLDCGRRMRAKDQSLSHFDHALNALLLTAYIALRQGDAAGYHTFAGDKRGMKPLKGKLAINTLINQLYTIESSVANSDYLQAAEVINTQRYKRSLVILVTNIREEDEDDLITAVKLLTRHHLVLVATLQETVLTEAIDQPMETLANALTYAGTIGHLNARARIVSRLAMEGVVVSDCLPSELPIALVNQYLALKRAGKF